MKTVIIFAALLLTSIAAHAEDVYSCMTPDALPNQGYEAVLWQSHALLKLNGQVIASLNFLRGTKSPGGDLPSERVYAQPIANGYTMDLQMGGFSGVMEVHVLHGGFSGNQIVVPSLTSCRLVSN